MGFNTAAIILNDTIHAIGEDVGIGATIREAVLSDARNGRVNARSPRESAGGAIQVLPSQHADYVQIVAVGGNTIRRIGISSRWEPEDLLRDLADQLGYSLRKKAKAP